MELTNHPSSLAISARRRVLFSAIAATCQEAGFQSADNFVLDILVQMFQAFLSELSYSAKCFSEHSGRSEPLASDLYMALIEMGFNITTLNNYCHRPNRLITPNPSQMPKQQTPKILQTGKRKQLLSYIPDYFPPFPDSHSYIATPTFKQPVKDYETLREKSSMHKRDVERALTRFMARTFHSSHTYSLFPDEQLSHLFPLIGIRPNNVPYLSALLPKDRLLNDHSDQFRSLILAQQEHHQDLTSHQHTHHHHHHHHHGGKKPSQSSKTVPSAGPGTSNLPTDDQSNPKQQPPSGQQLNESMDKEAATVATTSATDDPTMNEMLIENPYLLPPKIVNFH